MKNFEMSDSDSPEHIAEATQRAVVNSMQRVLKELKVAVDAPGLTWDQLHLFFEEFKKRKAFIIMQEGEM